MTQTMTHTISGPMTVAGPSIGSLLGAQGLAGTPFPSATLPLSDWRVSWREHQGGQAVLEIADTDGDLVGLAGSSSRPVLSIAAAWRGLGSDADGQRRWWALAIGHAGPDGAAPMVTFIRRVAVTGSIRRSVVAPATWRGLWLAAVPGLYTSISCSHAGAHRVRRLAPVPTFGWA